MSDLFFVAATEAAGKAADAAKEGGGGIQLNLTTILIAVLGGGFVYAIISAVRAPVEREGLLIQNADKVSVIQSKIIAELREDLVRIRTDLEEYDRKMDTAYTKIDHLERRLRISEHEKDEQKWKHERELNVEREKIRLLQLRITELEHPTP